MGAITRVPLHAPRAAPGTVALRASDRRNMGFVLSLAWLLVGAAVGVAAAGSHDPAALGRIDPVAGVTASDPVVIYSRGMPHDPMASRNWPGTLTTTVQLQPIPAFVGLDDPPGLGPAPAVDPAVARLLAQLRDEAKGSPTDPRPGAQALLALDFAVAQVGRPYVWGATGPDSYDCSGLTWQSYAHAEIALPRVSADQHAFGGTPVAIADLLPGDLVFFATAAWDPGAVHHVGMYVGHGLMVDAPHPGGYVRVEPVTAAGYVGAVRVVPELAGAPAPTGKRRSVATPPHTGPAKPSVPLSDASSTTVTPASSDAPTQTPSATDPTTAPATAPTTAPATAPATDPATEPAPAPSSDPPSTDPASTAPASTALPSPGTASPGG